MVNRLTCSDHERKTSRRARRLVQHYPSDQEMRVIYAITMPNSNQFPQLLDQGVAADRNAAQEDGELDYADVIQAGTDCQWWRRRR